MHNEERKSKSLGNVYTTENMQPSCFRGKLNPDKLFLTAIVPILKETYKSDFSERKPKYELIKTELL